jgi:aryl-alcohol dehydrogenase-like predicted oxidoreductase
VNRSDIVVSTKIFKIGNNVNTYHNTNRKHVVESIDASLKRLQLEYVDIVFAHIFD